MNQVPSRANWRATYPGESGSIDVETHVAFGWKMHRHVMQSGAVILVHSETDVPRNQAPNRAMYVRGRVACDCSDGAPRPDRLPGTWSAEMAYHPAGLTRLTALEESEFWCINWTANRRALPVLTPVRIMAGSGMEIAAGAKLFVLLGCSKAGQAPFSLVPDRAMTLTADSDLFGFIFSEGRP